MTFPTDHRQVQVDQTKFLLSLLTGLNVDTLNIQEKHHHSSDELVNAAKSMLEESVLQLILFYK